MKHNRGLQLKPFEVLAGALQDPTCGWTVGTFGALAEFSYEAGETPLISVTPTCLTAITNRGSLAITAHPKLRLFPYEGLSSLENAWTQGVLVCLPKAAASLNNRDRLFEMGTDTSALSCCHPDDVLFDLGLAVPHLDACIRSHDPDLLRQLRHRAGTELFDSHTKIVTTLTKFSPTRVFMSKIARIEVYQDIPEADGSSPSGPHTHLSEKLLSRRRSQAATIPVPDEWAPVLGFFPANPIRDHAGNLRTFDPAAHRYFQSLLAAYGQPELYKIKQQFLTLISDQADPSHFDGPHNKAERTALRVGIRQYAQQFGPSPQLAQWQRYFEPVDRQ